MENQIIETEANFQQQKHVQLKGLVKKKNKVDVLAKIDVHECKVPMIQNLYNDIKTHRNPLLKEGLEGIENIDEDELADATPSKRQLL